jgi:hypothetical protein
MMHPAAVLRYISIISRRMRDQVLTVHKSDNPHHNISCNKRLLAPYRSGSLHLLDTSLSTGREGYRAVVSIRLVDGVLVVYHWGLASLESLVDIFGLGVDMANCRLTQDGTTDGRAMHDGSK